MKFLKKEKIVFFFFFFYKRLKSKRLKLVEEKWGLIESKSLQNLVTMYNNNNNNSSNNKNNSRNSSSSRSNSGRRNFLNFNNLKIAISLFECILKTELRNKTWKDWNIRIGAVIGGDGGRGGGFWIKLLYWTFTVFVCPTKWSFE